MSNLVLEFELTAAGRSAVFNTASTGFLVTFSHIALGSGQFGQPYAVTGRETALSGEFVRAPISRGDRVSPNAIALQSLFSGLEQGSIREVGLFTSTGTLFALWAGAPIGEKIANSDYIFAATVALDGIDIDRVTWVAGGPHVNVLMVQPLFQIATALAALTRRNLERDAA
jgi:hypothetical protein